MKKKTRKKNGNWNWSDFSRLCNAYSMMWSHCSSSFLCFSCKLISISWWIASVLCGLAKKANESQHNSHTKEDHLGTAALYGDANSNSHTHKRKLFKTFFVFYKSALSSIPCQFYLLEYGCPISFSPFQMYQWKINLYII